MTDRPASAGGPVWTYDPNEWGRRDSRRLGLVANVCQRSAENKRPDILYVRVGGINEEMTVTCRVKVVGFRWAGVAIETVTIAAVMESDWGFELPYDQHLQPHFKIMKHLREGGLV